MNSEKFLTHMPQLAHLDAAITKACQLPGQLVKVQAGWYIIEIDCDLVEIEHMEDGEWIAREYDQKWHSDPEATLSKLKARLGI